jgi:phosphatidylglycerophosphate synthase
MTAPVPSRPAVARWYRGPLEWLEGHLPLPRLSPAIYTAASLLLSLAAFLATDGWALVAVLALVLLADWLDGATARRYGLTGRAGYVTDVLADRASEGLIFVAAGGTPLGQVFVLLWLVNCVLTLMSLRGGRHLALPLRFLYLVIVALRTVLR